MASLASKPRVRAIKVWSLARVFTPARLRNVSAMSAVHSAFWVCLSAKDWARIGNTTAMERRSPGSVGTSTGASAPSTAPLAGSFRVAAIECHASWL